MKNRKEVVRGYNRVGVNKFSLIICLCVMVLCLCSVGLTFAYFTSSAIGKGESITVAKLEATATVDEQSFSNKAVVSVSGVTYGGKVVSSASVKTATSSVNGLMRVRVYYEGAVGNEVSANTAIALNSALSFTTYAVASQYKWVEYGGYYYLCNASGNLLECSAGTAYTLFSGSNTVYLPNVDDFNLAASDLSGVSLCIKVEAVESTDIKASVTSASRLAELIAEKNIFDAEDAVGYIVRFDSLSDYRVPSVVVRGSGVTLPTVAGISVEWFKGYANGDYTNSVGSSGAVLAGSSISESMVLYAKYDQSKVVLMFADENGVVGNNPSTAVITYATSGSEQVTVPTGLSRVGYTLSAWTTSVGGVVTNFTVSSGKISVAKNIARGGSVITITPKWQINNYTATFVTGSVTLSDTTGLTYDSSVGGYKRVYTIEDLFKFPSIEKTNSAFGAWEVQSADSGSKWRVGDEYIAGEIGEDYFGNVTFVVQWLELAFTESLSNPTVVTSVSKVYGGDFYTAYLYNSTGLQPTFTSSNENIAKVVDSNYGTLKLIGVGSCTITASVSVSGKTSTVSYTLTVTPRSITNAIVAKIDAQNYTGSAINLKPQLTDLNKTLVEGTDYSLSYSGNTNRGTATITITGLGNYQGSSTTTTFTIV